MSLKNKFFSFLTLIMSVALFATVSIAQDSKAAAPNTEKSMKGEGRGMGKGKFHGGGHHRGMHRGRGMRMMMHVANLTDAQKLQIQAIHEANKPDAATIEEMKTLRAAKSTGTLTADQQSRLTALKLARQEKMKSVHEQVMNVLTPEQKAAIEAKKAERKQKMQERRQKRQQNPATTDTTLEG
jgi:protein CpxP